MTPVEQHPFHAIAALPLAQAEPLTLVVERDGAYVRLTADQNRYLFKRKSDPIDSIDRIGFSWSERIDLDNSLFQAGPQHALAAVFEHLNSARAAANGRKA